MSTNQTIGPQSVRPQPHPRKTGPAPGPAPSHGYWEYSQSTGTMTHVVPDGARNLIATGYSGFGSALDDPAAQDEGNAGPIPRGTWVIGPQQEHQLSNGKQVVHP